MKAFGLPMSYNITNTLKRKWMINNRQDADVSLSDDDKFCNLNCLKASHVCQLNVIARAILVHGPQLNVIARAIRRVFNKIIGPQHTNTHKSTGQQTLNFPLTLTHYTRHGLYSSNGRMPTRAGVIRPRPQHTD